MSAMKDDPTRPGVKFWDMTWTPTAKDKGANILCGIVDDTLGYVLTKLTFTVRNRGSHIECSCII